MLRVTPDNVEAVAEAFEKDPGLRVTKLDISECTSHQLPLLLETVLDCIPIDALTNTTSVTLGACIIDIEATNALKRLLTRCPALQSFALELCDWKYSGVIRKALVDRFSFDAQLVKEASNVLNHYNTLGDSSDLARNHWTVFKTSYVLLHDLFNACPSLERVRVNKSSAAAVWRPFSDVTQDVPASLISILFALSVGRLETIELRGNLISDPFLVGLGPLLAAGSRLKNLSLADNRLTDIGLLNLLGSIEADSCLRTLDLSGNYIQLSADETWDLLVEVLQKNPELTVRLSGNPIEREFGLSQIRFENCPSAMDEDYNVPTAPTNDDSSDSNFTGSDSAVASSSGSGDDSGDSGDDSDSVSLVSEGSDTWKLLDD